VGGGSRAAGRGSSLLLRRRRGLLARQHVGDRAPRLVDGKHDNEARGDVAPAEGDRGPERVVGLVEDAPRDDGERPDEDEEDRVADAILEEYSTQ